MAEVDFERALERMYAEAPAFADGESFAAAVERRLNRGWTVRRLMIGGAGLAGGVIGASQLILSRVVDRLETASEGSAKIISAGWREVSPSADLIASMPASSPMVWMALAMALLALGFVVTRLIDEF
ncbi:MAG: hypothetical protein ACK4YQ_09260 [Phenylobacterium sp.]|uniref:hypothetical protein n=1 Tax=Phenylobacterium sp. TaxID=1871053 RepID=UPI00391A4FB8